MLASLHPLAPSEVTAGAARANAAKGVAPTQGAAPAEGVKHG